MSPPPPGLIRLSEELAEVDLGDLRLERRAGRLLETLALRPDRSIPAACGTWAETKAAYRLFDTEAVTAQALLAPHFARTLERLSAQETVLCIQDTTELDYTDKKDITGLGTLNYAARRGLYLHPTLAVTPERLPLGLLECWSWTRPLLDAEKESIRWPEGYQRLCEDQHYLWEQAFDTRLVYVADREADLFEIYAAHRRRTEAGTQAADFLIRAQHDRRTERGPSLWACLAAAPELGQVEFELPHARGATSGDRGNGPGAGGSGRRIVQSLRATRLCLMPPQEHAAHERPLSLSALLARELNPPRGEAPIEWVLLTNRDIATQAAAEELLGWYLCRWQIEIYFRVLKSGCKIEELQLEHLARLEPAIAMYLLIAWRVLYLTMIGRDCPELPADVVFELEEWRAIYLVATRRPPPADPPSINAIIRMVAAFGGFLNRTRDGMPGPKTIWIGLQRCKDFVLALEAQRAAQSAEYG